MDKQALQDGRYLLFLDILGFSELVESVDVEDVYATIEEALQAFDRWEELNKCFRTIYFSDTFIFYQDSKGYGDWAFSDVYAIAGMILSALLAKGIAARGSITFGPFEVREDSKRKRTVYFGRALVEAYRAEQRENWVGITIQPSAWIPFEANNAGVIDAYESEGVWIHRHDDVLLLNPFIKVRSWFPLVAIGEVSKPYRKWDEPEFPNEIKALHFLRQKISSHTALGDFSSSVASKYQATDRFLRKVLGEDLYAWTVAAFDDL